MFFVLRWDNVNLKIPMKKLLYLFLLLSVLLFPGCSKEQQLNRKLDDSWTAVIYNGYVPPKNVMYHFTFNADKGGRGTGTAHFVNDPAGTDHLYAMEYFIKDDQLVIIINENPSVYTVEERKRKKITLTDTYGNTTILERD